jgi:N-acetylglutamate synthase-like GNAT family acetyltransferase
MSGGVVRKAELKDIPGLLNLVAENSEKLLPRTEEDYSELIETTWIAEEDNLIVGCATLEVYSQKIAEIRSVAVKAGYREQGYGKRLVEIAVREAQSRNIKQIMVVTSSPEYFEKLNFGPSLNEKYALFWNGN